MSERFEMLDKIALYKYTSFPFLSLKLVAVCNCLIIGYMHSIAIQGKAPD